MKTTNSNNALIDTPFSLIVTVTGWGTPPNLYSVRFGAWGLRPSLEEVAACLLRNEAIEKETIWGADGGSE